MEMSTFKTPKGTELPFLSLRGKEYLEVKYRLVWFREERPDWGIETEVIETNDNFTRAKATIRNEKGQIMAQGHKVEHKTHFADHVEKAETGAVGRALALCGYGTQFAPELDEEERIVDAPANVPKKARGPKTQEPPTKPRDIPNLAPKAKSGALSEAQLKRLFAIAKSKSWPNEELQRVLYQGYGISSSKELDRHSYDELCSAIESGSNPDDVIKAKQGRP
jgi:hypothetical protein